MLNHPLQPPCHALQEAFHAAKDIKAAPTAAAPAGDADSSSPVAAVKASNAAAAGALCA
jgi:hypothetical protein